MTRLRFAVFALACSSVASAQAKKELPLKYVGPPTVPAITAGDLMTRLYKFADDSMMGRPAGTAYNLKGNEYIASELKRLGLQPAGDNGGYIQHALVLRTVDPGSTLSVDGKNLELWKEFAPRDQGGAARPFDGLTVVYGGMVGIANRTYDFSHLIDPADAAGKVVLLTLLKDPQGHVIQALANRNLITLRLPTAAAIIVRFLDELSPTYIDSIFKTAQPQEKHDPWPVTPSYAYVTEAVAAQLLGADPDKAAVGTVGKVLHGSFRSKQVDAPGGNVVAILPGSDPKLRGQYIAIGAHNDHIGFSQDPVDSDSLRAWNIVAAPEGADSDSPPDSAVTADQWKQIHHMIDSMRALHGGKPRLDSINNGADDDGSGSVSVLEIAEAFAKSSAKPKRSLLFIWHVAEELGLYGSEYFTDHPTVPRDSIVAELNMDMVGRGGAGDFTGHTKDGKPIHGGPGYLQVVGSRRLSTELGELAETVNTEAKFGLHFDYSLDANGHDQQIYCRSDHYEYARYGIPIAFFTTGGHADYHQVTDEPQYIDYDRMATVANFVKSLATKLGDLDHRIAVDHAKPDPHGECQQ